LGVTEITVQVLKKTASKLGVGIVALFILFMGLKGCAVTTWTSPSEPTTYAVRGADGRSMVMIFLPKHETYIAYTEQKANQMEIALTRMRGSYATHYFWRLWGLEGPRAGLLGYRIYPPSTKPIEMEISVLNKYLQGSETPSLQPKGDRTNVIMLFSDNAVRFEGMWLRRESTNPQLLGELRQRVPSVSQ
jgi:hypothetical protein